MDNPWRAEWLKRMKVKPRMTNCRMEKDIQSSENRRWYVFTGDFGGQVFLTIPVEMVPSWVGRRRMRRLLRLLNSMAWGCHDPEDGASVHIVEDLVDGSYAVTDEEDWELLMRTNNKLGFERGVKLPDMVTTEPFVPETHLCGWKAVGSVSGGMGGGILLDGDLWLHYELLYRGLDGVNAIRRFLGLGRLETLEVVMSKEEAWHAALITSVLG